ncbi:nitrogenase component 1 [Konateibacter massiliensis]|uniref:nitrogenase component 1 n=1 Tax=Konateibacter massiliensis TaxID=2002841 RepID=UPI000C15D38D|nr:nitrogenase component 1 [Konateibacter massiliensis]
MPLYKNRPEPSGRMGLLWALAPVSDAAIIEFGSMGHMIYADKFLGHTGLVKYAKLVTTHLSEKDIALGITKRLEDSVKEIVRKKEAKAIFLLPSSVPEMIGTDLEAIGGELQFSYPDIPIVTFKAGNFKATKEQGMEEAYYSLVKKFSEFHAFEAADRLSKGTLRFNLIGPACDWSRFQSDAREISRMLTGAFHMEEAAIFGSSSTVESLLKMSQADITLVLRKDGIKAAKELERQYKIPYLYLTPYGYTGTLQWIERLEEVLAKKADISFLEQEKQEVSHVVSHCREWVNYRKAKAKLWVGGEDELSGGLQEFAVTDLGFLPGEGEIHMSDLHELRENPGKCSTEIRRSTLSNDINPYEAPFMGFRGAMNLCSLWYQHLTTG